jgi:hypothetical protein
MRMLVLGAGMVGRVGAGVVLSALAVALGVGSAGAGDFTDTVLGVLALPNDTTGVGNTAVGYAPQPCRSPPGGRRTRRWA